MVIYFVRGRGELGCRVNDYFGILPVWRQLANYFCQCLAWRGRRDLYGGDLFYRVFRDRVTGFLYLWFRVGLGNRGNMARLPRGLNAYRGNDVLAVLSFLAAKRYLIYISLAIKAGSLSADSSLAIDSGFTS